MDQPLVEQMDTTAARKFLICDYNRDGDSFRSPWSNEYFPPIEDGEGIVPSEEVRALEDTANKLFEAYCEQCVFVCVRLWLFVFVFMCLCVCCAMTVPSSHTRTFLCGCVSAGILEPPTACRRCTFGTTTTAFLAAG